MEPLLWTCDDVVQFIDHPDQPLRRWAQERLIHRFPGQAGDHLAAMLDDQNSYIVLKAAEFLSTTGDTERYGPVLLDHLQRVQDKRFGYLAKALAVLQVREAVALIAARLRERKGQLDPGEFIRLLRALGQLGGEKARDVLWAVLDDMEGTSVWEGTAMESILEIGRLDDVARLVQRYRDWATSSFSNSHLDAFAEPVGAARLAQEVRAAAQSGFDAALDRAASWLGLYPLLSAKAVVGLSAAFRQGHRGVFDILLHEAHRLVKERGHAVSEWRSAWEAGERLAGYRREAVLTPLVLEAFASNTAPRQDQRQDESALGLALLCQLSIGNDDQALLEEADNPDGVAFGILAQDRQNVLPGIVDRVAARGPSVLPFLRDLIEPYEFSWGMVRGLQVLEKLARSHPGSCDSFIPTLIETLNDEQSDYVLEPCSDVLRAIGPAAVELIAPHLYDDDTSRQSYLTYTLAEIPTESAAQAILDWTTENEIIEEMHISSLSNIGSPLSIETFYDLWKPGDAMLAEALLVLCELNGVPKPELDEWRRLVIAEDKRVDGLSSGVISSFMGRSKFVKSSQPFSSRPGTRRSKKSASKGLSKKERKRRTRQRRRKRRR